MPCALLNCCSFSFFQRRFVEPPPAPPPRTNRAAARARLRPSLFYKGFLLTAAARQNALVKLSPESQEIYLRLKGYRRSLADKYSTPLAEREHVAELEENANAAEKELARLIAGYANATRQIQWQQVQSALKTGETAVEFVRFNINFPEKTGSVQYAALVLFPGNPESSGSKFVPLFEEKQLEALLKTAGARRSDYVNGIYLTAKPGQKTLLELVWQPLEKELAGVKTVYFSPSGLLHRINLSAIPISETENLGDRFRFVELGSTRQLVVPETSRSGNFDAVLFGGIHYDMDATAIGAANADLKNDLARNRGALSFENADSTFRGGTWAFLPWTEKEINSIATILASTGLKPSSRTGFSATEEIFKSIGSGQPSPRILHIATHGYFFPDPVSTSLNHPDGSVRLVFERSRNESVFKMSEHPMIRSGLLLAGANHAWKTGKPAKPGLEDGILTAYEISQMDLSGTELVVLSACETGLGEIQGNEGVYGLQRAFKIAGAKYLIMSLWQVPDFQTSEMMGIFYKKWLSEKMPLPEAFRAAQQVIREKYEHPYFWAGFVLVE